MHFYNAASQTDVYSSASTNPVCVSPLAIDGKPNGTLVPISD